MASVQHHGTSEDPALARHQPSAEPGDVTAKHADRTCREAQKQGRAPERMKTLASYVRSPTLVRVLDAPWITVTRLQLDDYRAYLRAEKRCEIIAYLFGNCSILVRVRVVQGKPPSPGHM